MYYLGLGGNSCAPSSDRTNGMAAHNGHTYVIGRSNFCVLYVYISICLFISCWLVRVSKLSTYYKQHFRSVIYFSFVNGQND